MKTSNVMTLAFTNRLKFQVASHEPRKVISLYGTFSGETLSKTDVWLGLQDSHNKRHRCSSIVPVLGHSKMRRPAETGESRLFNLVRSTGNSLTIVSWSTSFTLYLLCCYALADRSFILVYSCSPTVVFHGSTSLGD